MLSNDEIKAKRKLIDIDAENDIQISILKVLKQIEINTKKV